jgi:hypothetical protein
MLPRKIFICLVVILCAPVLLEAGTARIFKVLPHYLDHDGRHVLSPSLFERDAYQAVLRENPEKSSALRFDVNWKAGGVASSSLILRIELRGSEQTLGVPLVIERPVRPARLFRNWSTLRLEGEEYLALGRLLAWRATLWEGDVLLAEEKSFLW